MAQTPTRTAASPIQHPVYVTWAPTWRKLVDVYDGSGGFLDGTYLVAHPREWKDFNATTPRVPSKKLKARRALARYENVAGTILDQKRAALFRESINRTVGASDKPTPHPIEEWWKNVDGAGTTIDDWMGEAFTFASLFGHVAHLMDLPANLDAETAADIDQPFLRLYTPLDIPDWRLDAQGRLLSIRLLEAVTEDDPKQPLRTDQFNERLLTREDWALLQPQTRTLPAAELESGPHPFGVVPVVIQYAKRKKLAQLIGQPVLGDPSLYIDLYNITSELRELLRNQTFGILAVALGSGDQATSVITAREMLGDEKGAENVLFTPNGAEYIQPDSTNVTVYQEERQQLLRTIYRLAAIPWESDSQDAESEGSMKLKREDMNQILAAYGDECEKTEYEIARMWFRAMHPDTWEKEFEKAQVVIRYPDTFDVTPFAEILEQAQAAIALPMGPTFMAEQCKRLVPKFMPDLPLDISEKVLAEIDKAATEQAEMDRKTKEAELKAIAEPAGGFGA